MLLASVGGAGCLQSPGASSIREPTDLADQETGGIRGTVLNEEWFPLVGARVTLFPSDGDAQVGPAEANSAGAFQFGHLAPGSYRLESWAEGYYPTKVEAQVQAEQVTDVTILMVVQPAREPYTVVTPWTGLNSCGVALVITPAGFCANFTVLPGNKNVRIWNITDGFAAIVAETSWPGGDEASTWFYNYSMEQSQTTGGSAFLDVGWGKKPLRVELLPGAKRENLTGIFSNLARPVSDGGAFLLRETVFWLGYFSDAFSPLDPACQAFSNPRCAGVGATTDFRFTTWLSVFVYERPSDLGSYSVLPDH